MTYSRITPKPFDLKSFKSLVSATFSVKLSLSQESFC